MKKFLFVFLLLLSLNLLASPFDKENWQGQGELSFEFRQFKNDDIPSTVDGGQAVFGRVETRWEEDAYKTVFRGLFRTDRLDSSRDVMFIEDAYFSMNFMQEWRLYAGYKIFNWTATEAFHPADVVNSRNWDSNLEYLDKRGELTLELNRSVWNGDISFYYWPRYERPLYPSASNRLGFGQTLRPPVFVDDHSNDRRGQQWGVRLDQHVGTADISLHVLQHMDRNFAVVGESNYTLVPIFISPSGVIPNSTPTIPYFFRDTQVGGTLQYVLGGLIIKAEGAIRKFKKDLNILTARGFRTPVDHQEIAAGFEYGIVHDNGTESTFFLEGDTILGTSEAQRAELSAFQRDVFLGYRFAFNDQDSREIFVAGITDLERANENFYSAKYSQRIGDSWKVGTGLRFYEAPQKGTYATGLEVLNGDNQFFLTLTRYL